MIWATLFCLWSTLGLCISYFQKNNVIMKLALDWHNVLINANVACSYLWEW